MTRATGTLIKFAVFGLVMALLTAFLFVIFGQYENRFDERLFGGLHRCVAAEVRGLRAGRGHPGRHRRRTCRCRPDSKVLVEFDADRNIKLTTGTKAAIRYLNLVGDRYLELVDAPRIDEDPAARARRSRWTAPRPRWTSTCCSAG